MTGEQVQKYEYCKKYLENLEAWKKKLPFGCQNFGCGSGSPSIEFALQNAHSKMHQGVLKSIEETIDFVEQIIDEL